jgi:hypothetical protein
MFCNCPYFYWALVNISHKQYVAAEGITLYYIASKIIEAVLLFAGELLVVNLICFRGADISNLAIIETASDASVTSPSSTVAVTKPVPKRIGRSVSECLATIKGTQLRDSPRKPLEDCSVHIPTGLCHCNEKCLSTLKHLYKVHVQYFSVVGLQV